MANESVLGVIGEPLKITRLQGQETIPNIELLGVPSQKIKKTNISSSFSKIIELLKMVIIILGLASLLAGILVIFNRSRFPTRPSAIEQL